MPYIPHGIPPTEAIGKCPWCDEKDTILHMISAEYNGETIIEYVCANCLVKLDKLRKYRKEKVLVNE